MKRFILILACTLRTTLSASLTDWPMHQRNAGHTGTNTDVLIQFPLALQRVVKGGTFINTGQPVCVTNGIYTTYGP